MGKFVHQQTRLYTDLRRAYNYFYKESEMKKWLDENAVIEAKDSQTAKFKISTAEALLDVGCEYLDCERERIINFKWTDSYGDSTVEINFMNCRYDRSYCSEIHVVHKNFDDDEERQHLYNDMWRDNLEKLRELVNKDWIIEDRDLALNILK